MTVEQPEEQATKAGAEAPSAAEQEIAADIERTRAELGDTVEQLAAKVHVGSRARHAAENLEHRIRHAAGQAPGQVTSTARAAAGTARKYWVHLTAAAVVVVVVAVAARKRRR
jgi:hypothetical protein